VTRLRFRIALVAVLLVIAALASGPWAEDGGPGVWPGRRHKPTVVKFKVSWIVSSRDVGRHVRSDSAAIVWHAGDATHNQVHYAGTYVSEPVTLGRGAHIVSINGTVDAAATTTCTMWINNKPTRHIALDGHCHLSTVVHVNY
jgi:hypothetical protein